MVADSVLLSLENGRFELVPGASRLVQVADDSLRLRALSAVRGYRGNRDCGLVLKNISSRPIWALFNWEMRSAKQKLNQGKACEFPVRKATAVAISLQICKTQSGKGK